MKLILPLQNHCPMCKTSVNVNNSTFTLNGTRGEIKDSNIFFKVNLRRLVKNTIIITVEHSLNISSNEFIVNFIDKNSGLHCTSVPMEIIELYKKYISNLKCRLHYECTDCLSYRWTSNSFFLSLKENISISIDIEEFDIKIDDQNYYIYNFYYPPKKWTEIRYCQRNKNDLTYKTLKLPFLPVNDKIKITNKIKLLLPFY